MAGESLLLWGEWGAAAAVRSSIRAFLLKPSSGDCVPCFLPLGSYTGTTKVWAACSMEVAVISHDSLVVLAGGAAVFSGLAGVRDGVRATGNGERLHCLAGRAATECPKACMVEQQQWELWHSVRGRPKLRSGVGTQRRCGSPQHGRELVQAQEAGGL